MIDETVIQPPITPEGCDRYGVMYEDGFIQLCNTREDATLDAVREMGAVQAVRVRVERVIP